RADIYACGVMLFELVTGRAPFEGESAEAVLAKHAAEPPPRPSAIAPDLPIGYDAIVLRALAKSPADRFQTARELRTALKRLLR
ncbi:MAG: serine/threonine protein kinase, partial [Myxococcales bacterium]|nr:serine/threonine protein kinase [Myxococcales bacterium]